MSAWRMVRLGDVIEAKYGKALPQARRHGGEVPVYGSNGVVGWHDKAITSGKTIVIGRKGSLGEVSFSRIPCWPIDTTYFIDDPGPYEMTFLGHLLRSLGLTELDQSTAIPGLSRDQLYDIEVPVPTKEEQARISQLITTAQEKQTTSIDHLKVALRAMRRFRQAVLAAACSGRLTTDWRNRDMEDAAVTNREGPLPAGWQLVTLGDLAVSIRGGSTEPPSNEATDYPILRSSSVRPFSVDYSDVRFLSAEQSKREDNYLRDGDLLVTRLSGSVDYVGNAAVVRDLNGRRIQYPDRLFCCRLKDSRQSRYVEVAIAGPQVRRQIEAASRSAAGHQRISISDLKGFTLTCPTLEEQHEIVQRVERLLSLADGLIRRVRAAELRIGRSGQATLARAFRGEPTTGSGGMSPEDAP